MQLNGLLGSQLSPTASGCGSSALPTQLAPTRTNGQDDATAGVLAQISDAARSLFAQMRKDGVAAQSFDLHLDLRQLGISVGAAGGRSVEGHSLTIDLHVEAQQGSFKTDSGETSFGKLDLSFSLEETYIRATDGGDRTPAHDTAGAPTRHGAPATKPPANGGLIDGLKKLISLLDRTNGQPGPDDGLGDLLTQIGRALEAMAKRASGPGAHPSDPPAAGQPSATLDGFALQEHVHVHSMHVTQTVDSAGPTDPVQSAQTQAS